MILKQFKCTIKLDKSGLRGTLSVVDAKGNSILPDDWQFKEFRNHDSAPFLYVYTAGSTTKIPCMFLYLKDKALPADVGAAEYRGSIQLNGLWHIAGPV